MSLQDLQNGAHCFDPTSSQEDFLEQMFCGLQSGGSWPEISTGGGGVGVGVGVGVSQNKSALPWDADLFNDQSAFLTTKLRQHQISTGNGEVNNPSSAAKPLLLQQQLLLSRGLAGDGDYAFFQHETVDPSSFKSLTGDNSIQALFNGFTGSIPSDQTQNFEWYPPAQGFGTPGPAAPAINHATAAGCGGGGPPAQPRQRVRARRGQATDPHSIAERLRRERIAERMKSLQELVPNANKTDKASMLDEIIDYVKFLQLQVKVLSMSRMGGGGGGGAPLGEGGRDGAQVGVGGEAGRRSAAAASSSNNETMTVAENQVVKLMEEDMGSAMQYLQGKGLCLMPISLATAISTATTTCHLSSARNNHPILGGGEGGGTSSPDGCVLSQSANELVPVKDSISVLKS